MRLSGLPLSVSVAGLGSDGVCGPVGVFLTWSMKAVSALVAGCPTRVMRLPHSTLVVPGSLAIWDFHVSCQYLTKRLSNIELAARIR
jgi:hypothetical protein